MKKATITTLTGVTLNIEVEDDFYTITGRNTGGWERILCNFGIHKHNWWIGMYLDEEHPEYGVSEIASTCIVRDDYEGGNAIVNVATELAKKVWERNTSEFDNLTLLTLINAVTSFLIDKGIDKRLR